MEETLGKRIIANRKRMGLTQDKLAEQLGVTAQAVSKWENEQSCPDITMLPKLAQVFGISTDELLGMEKTASDPVLEAEVMEDDDGHRIDLNTESGGKWEMHWDAGRKSGIGFAVWVLLTGAILLASNILHWNAGLWDILWPTALLVFGIFGLIPKFSFFRLGCGLFGGYFLLTNLGLAQMLPGKEILLPGLLVLLGLSLLADALKSSKKPRFALTHNGKKVYTRDGKKKNSSFEMADGCFSCSTSFGEDHHLIDLPRLTGGSAQVSFGELTVDMTGCGEIADGCRIDANCSFGELDLRLPRSCRVEHASHTAFSQVNVSGHPDPDAKITVYVDCDVSFGEINISFI